MANTVHSYGITESDEQIVEQRLGTEKAGQNSKESENRRETKKTSTR